MKRWQVIRKRRFLRLVSGLLAWCQTFFLLADRNVYLSEVPDYAWFGGCFGTATGNLMGYWDRHGLPNYYTGPTRGGVAPLGTVGNDLAIVALWSSAAGRDGRPVTMPGHQDDYWFNFESTQPDPYLVAGRVEHTPDCIGDFIGLSQRKWSNLNGECDGNIDGFCFNYFHATGERHTNFTPPTQNGIEVREIQSGLRAWSRYRGYESESFSQLSEFNPSCLPGKGFRFEDLQAEIDAGYPVLLFMQNYHEFSRTVESITGQNPGIHAVLAYGYVVTDEGQRYVRYRTSWASGDTQFNIWTGDDWTPDGPLRLPIRGAIGFHPLPKITRSTRSNEGLRLDWDGPSAILYDALSDSELQVHWYIVERARELGGSFQPVTSPSPNRSALIPDCCDGTAFFRIKLVSSPEQL